MSKPTGLLFVCLGNICRSPLAKAIFAHQAAQRGLSDRFAIDSCGTGHWHVGEGADPRTIMIAAKRGIPFAHTARQLHPRTDFQCFDLLLAMDRVNAADLVHSGAPKERVKLVRSFDPLLQGAPLPTLDVPDPYYGAGDGFETVFDMLDRACAGLLDHLTGRSAQD